MLLRNSVNWTTFGAARLTLVDAEVVDEARKPFEDFEPPVQIHEVRKGLPVRQAGDAFLWLRSKDVLGDLLSTKVRGNLVVAVEVAAALAASGLRLDPSLYLWPLHVMARETRRVRREYTVLWAIQRRDVLDLAAAEVEYYEGTDVISKVTRWAFDPSSTPDLDLYSTPYHTWIASEEFRTFVESHGYTGFEFKRIG